MVTAQPPASAARRQLIAGLVEEAKESLRLNGESGESEAPRSSDGDVLEKRTFKEAVDADWKLSREYGITGVPTFVVGRQGVVGAQPYEVLEQLVKEAGSQEEGER